MAGGRGLKLKAMLKNGEVECSVSAAHHHSVFVCLFGVGMENLNNVFVNNSYIFSTI